MKRDKSKLFLKLVNFDEIFSRIHYETDFKNPSKKIPRKILYSTIGKKEGFIIGERSFYEGTYYPGCKPQGYYASPDDYEPPSLENRKRFDFYRIMVSYNEEYYVLKKHIHEMNRNIFDENCPDTNNVNLDFIINRRKK